MTVRLLFVSVLFAVASGCGSSTTGDEGADLGATPPDLAVPGVPPDLGGASDLGSEPDLGPPIVHQIPGVVVTTLAGSSTPGGADGTGAAAQFANPTGIALGANGLVYVTEYDGNRVRTVDASGVTGTVPVTPPTGDTFACPFGIAVLGPSQLLVQTDCDLAGNKNDTSGTVWTIDLTSGAATPIVQHQGRPRGLVLLEPDVVAVSDRLAETVLKLTVSTVTTTLFAGAPRMAGYFDGSGSAARFNSPYGDAKLPDGSIVLADFDNHAIRAISPTAAVTTFAGSTTPGMVDAPRAEARFYFPKVVAVDAAGEVFVSDTGNHRIRRVAADGTVETVAGNGIAGFADGTGDQAELYGQEGIAVSADGKTLWFTDGNNGDGSAYHRVRKLTIP